MMKRTLTIALALLGTATMSASALAATPRPIPGAQAQMRRVLSRLDLRVDSQRVVYNARGRQDLVLFSRTPVARVVEAAKRAYRTAKPTAEGYTVKGYAHIVATDTWTITLEKQGRSFVAEVGRSGLGSRVTLWGLALRAPAPLAQRSLPPSMMPNIQLAK